MNYRQTIQYLYDRLPVYHRIGPAAYKPDIGNIIQLCDFLDQPQEKFRSIHVAGTNGKGSVSHMLASILQCAGFKTGLHTSPHLKDFRERFRINGRMIRKSEVTDFVRTWENDFESVNPSFFEMSVALAFDQFAKNQVDIAVIETGMGGRLDSTNILQPEVSVITNIGWDHMMFLGNTLEKIAGEKAGIIKPGIPVVIGETKAETQPVFIETATKMNAPVFFADDHIVVKPLPKTKNVGSKYSVYKKDKLFIDELYCTLGGHYQQKNIATVLMTVEVLRDQGYTISDDQIKKGISTVVKTTGLKGRWQVLSKRPLVIADIGHNVDGLQYLVNQISETPHKHLHVVFGSVNDKDIMNVLRLLPNDASYYFCRPHIPRGLDTKELLLMAKEAGLKGKKYNSVREAYANALKNAASNDLVFIGGSTFVVAEVV